jgi:hypothetical protein
MPFEWGHVRLDIFPFIVRELCWVRCSHPASFSIHHLVLNWGLLEHGAPGAACEHCVRRWVLDYGRSKRGP